MRMELDAPAPMLFTTRRWPAVRAFAIARALTLLVWFLTLDVPYIGLSTLTYLGWAVGLTLLDSLLFAAGLPNRHEGVRFLRPRLLNCAIVFGAAAVPLDTLAAALSMVVGRALFGSDPLGKWFIVLGVTMIPAFFAFVMGHAAGRMAGRTLAVCGRCGCNLIGNVAGRCPACGALGSGRARESSHALGT